MVVFPQGAYYLGKSGAGGLKLPAGNTNWLTLSGYGATIRLSANVPRFLDFNRTADYQTFAYFRVEGFAVDGANVAGMNHVVGFSFIDGAPLARFNAESIVVRDVRAYNVLTDTTWPNPSSCREGVYIATHQWDSNEPTTNTIRDIYIENVRIEGGNVGFSVGGVTYGTSGWSHDPATTNITVDNVHVDRCWWDSGVRATKFWASNGMIMGWGARGGSLYVNDCEMRGSGDNNYEINGWQQATVQGCVSEDSIIGYFFQNCGWPLGDVGAQQIVFRDSVYRNTAAAAAPASTGWVIGNENPMGTVTLERCSMASEATGRDAQFLAMWDGVGYTIKALNLLNCTYRESGVVANTETYPFKVYVMCDGSPDGGPTAVTVDGCTMYYRASRTGTANYVVRLMEIGGSSVTWAVRNSQFDGAIAGGGSQGLRALCLGDAFTSRGSGVVDGCVFKTNALDSWAVRVGDSDRLTVAGTVDVQNCDFTGIGADGTPVYVSAGDANQSFVRLLNNLLP